VAARTTGRRRRRWGHRGTTCLCISPRSGGEAGGARTAAGDGELVREEAAGEEALWPEAIAISSGLKLVLDEEEVTAEQIPDSDGDGEGWRWLVMACRGGRPRAERSEACARRKESGGGASIVPTRDKAARPSGTTLTSGDWH
jgi:hypothetical protein